MATRIRTCSYTLSTLTSLLPSSSPSSPSSCKNPGSRSPSPSSVASSSGSPSPYSFLRRPLFRLAEEEKADEDEDAAAAVEVLRRGARRGMGGPGCELDVRLAAAEVVDGDGCRWREEG